MNYVEVTEENRVIIALYQEKAYNKIKHGYLWETLKTFNVPMQFIEMVKTLYQHAYTQVAINGVFSTPFHITRGAQQGNPSLAHSLT